MSSIALLLVVVGGGAAAMSHIGEDRSASVSQSASAASPTRLFLKKDEARPGAAGPYGVRSLLKINRPLKYGEFVWDDRSVPDGPVWIRADLKRQVISVFRGGHEIGTAVILYGVGNKETPLGTFPIIAKKKDHHSITYDAPMPFMLRLTEDGVAIHGSDVRRGRATHGCIGIPLDFARRLFDGASKGDLVSIV
jgi:hypothetical protein